MRAQYAGQFAVGGFARRGGGWLRGLLAGWCAVGVMAGNSVAASAVRIMPLGDSITYGVGDAGGELHQVNAAWLLTAEGAERKLRMEN